MGDEQIGALPQAARAATPDGAEPVPVSGIAGIANAEDALREAEAWLRAISDWLLANDHDMTLPSGILDTDPLDIADSLAEVAKGKSDAE